MAQRRDRSMPDRSRAEDDEDDFDRAMRRAHEEDDEEDSDERERRQRRQARSQQAAADAIIEDSDDERPTPGLFDRNGPAMPDETILTARFTQSEDDAELSYEEEAEEQEEDERESKQPRRARLPKYVRLEPAEQAVQSMEAFEMVQGRRAADDAVTCETEETIDPPSGGFRFRPKRIAGRVHPQATGDRDRAPIGSAGWGGPQEQKAMANNPNHNRGHLFALDLGGPDIPENIVPQWSLWQQSGAWRQMERDVKDRALRAEEAGGTVHLEVTPIYRREATDPMGSRRDHFFPYEFVVEITTTDDKGMERSVICKLVGEINDAHFKQLEKILDLADEEDARELEDEIESDQESDDESDNEAMAPAAAAAAPVKRKHDGATPKAGDPKNKRKKPLAGNDDEKEPRRSSGATGAGGRR